MILVFRLFNNELFYIITKIFLEILVGISFWEECVLFEVETCHFRVEARQSIVSVRPKASSSRASRVNLLFVCFTMRATEYHAVIG